MLALLRMTSVSTLILDAGLWSLTYLPNATQPNTYSVLSIDRTGSCNNILSVIDCSGNYVDMFFTVSPAQCLALWNLGKINDGHILCQIKTI